MSPCVNICKADRTNLYCIACCRTLMEIQKWQWMTEEEQAEIEAAWEENYFEGMEELGWSNDDTDYILQGPLELSDEDGNVIAQGEE